MKVSTKCTYVKKEVHFTRKKELIANVRLWFFGEKTESEELK